MTRRMLVLWALVAALALAVGVDRLRIAPAPDAPAPQQPPGAGTPAPPAQGALNPVAMLPPDSLAPIFDRPLFRPSRSPDTAPAPEASAEPPAAAPAADLPPRLLGTISQPRPGGAFLAHADGGTTGFVGVGQTFGPWRLLAVGDGWADLTGPDGPLHLAFPRPTTAEAQQ